MRLVVVDDDTSYAKGLQELFNDPSRFHWIRHYANPIRFLGDLPALEVDLVLLDIEMPKLRGVECVGEIKKAKPACKVVMLTVFEDDDLILSAMTNGADGYLIKDSSPKRILQAIEETLQGGAGMSPSVARKVVQHLRQHAGGPTAGPENRLEEFGINKREEEVLRLLANGDRYAEIGQKLFISKDTVKTHIRHIYEKLGVNNRTAAIKRSGL